MPNPCDSECQKIIIDGGALAAEAAAYNAKLNGANLVQQETIALERQLTVEGAVAEPLASRYRTNATITGYLSAMSQDQCDLADTLRAKRDAGESTNAFGMKIRKRRLSYHYFLRDLALGEPDAVWPPSDYEVIT